MIYIISVNSRDRNDCEKLFEQNKKLINHDDKYTLKVNIYNKDISYIQRLDDWMREVNILKKINKYQENLDIVVSPKYYDSWYQTKQKEIYFYICIEKCEGNFDKFLETFGEAMGISHLKILFSHMQLLQQSYNICLNENINLENIMYKKIGVSNYYLMFVNLNTTSDNASNEDKNNDLIKFKAICNKFY